MADSSAQPEFLTTREVAALLRVKERKVYDLAAAGEIPCRRVTGKLLFPRGEIESWIAGGAPVATASLPPKSPVNVVAGSHDPLLDWALRESASGLASYYNGSLDGLARVVAGEAVACGMHVLEPDRDDWNVGHVSGALRGRPFVLVEFARRRQGLIVAPAATNPISTIRDLRGHSIVHRQPTAGARILFEHLLTEAGLDDGSVTPLAAIARTEADAAEIVATGKADATLGIEAMAIQYQLDFIPLVEERFDLLADRRACFEPPLQALFAYCRGGAFAEKAQAMGGYSVAAHGTVHWNGG